MSKTTQSRGSCTEFINVKDSNNGRSKINQASKHSSISSESSQSQAKPSTSGDGSDYKVIFKKEQRPLTCNELDKPKAVLKVMNTLGKISKVIRRSNSIFDELQDVPIIFF